MQDRGQAANPVLDFLDTEAPISEEQSFTCKRFDAVSGTSSIESSGCLLEKVIVVSGFSGFSSGHCLRL